MTVNPREGHRGDDDVNFEVTPHHKKFKWFTVGGTPIKISNWNDNNYKNYKNWQNFVTRKK